MDGGDYQGGLIMNGKNYTEFTDTPVPDGHIRIYDDHTGRSAIDIPEFVDDGSPEAELFKILKAELQKEILEEEVKELLERMK
jgi:hypothetical protein